MITSNGAGAVLLSALVLCACTGSESDTHASGSGAAGTTATTTTSGSGGATSSTSGSGAGAGSSAGGGGSGPIDPCGDALFCEKFDDYPTVSTLDDQQQLGPWHAAVKTGATMNLDPAHVVSGSSALHMHIDSGATSGGRLFADGAEPIFADSPTHVYGRLMMYIDPNGTSIHWTFFGVSGDAEPSSPVTGRNASYILSSLPKNDVNTFSFVYGLEAQGGDPFHDCWAQSGTSMPTAAWSCVSFEIDSVARKLRMYTGGGVDPILSVDETGQGCVGNVPGDSPWYGPAITQLFVGAWSFHPMDAPLDVWIDDVVVDTKPVACPPM